MPFSDILCSIGVIEHPDTASFTILPFALVTISKELTTLTFRFDPYMRTPTILHVILPLPVVLLTAGDPLHHPITALLIIYERSIIEVQGWVRHLALSVFVTTLEVAFIISSTFEHHFTLTMPQPVVP